VLGIDAAAYRRHWLHAEDRTWAETNCYADVWIEVLHALRLDPLPMLPFTVALDFEGDQWTFFKPPHHDLRVLYGLEVNELNVWRPLLEHAEHQLSAGKLIFTEADALHLPDTQGTDYRRQHTKTTIVLETLDVPAQRLGYFHNGGYHVLEGEDFDGVFRRAGPMDPFVLPLFAEFVRLDRVERHGAAELAARSRALLSGHLRRRPATNPFTRFAPVFAEELQRLQQLGIDVYHQYAFATLRQVGANFELLAAYLRWLDTTEPGVGAAAAAEMETLSSTAKALILKGARAVAARRPTDVSLMLETMAASWEKGMAHLAPYTG
ncbi:MAG: DUF1839 family protein, partial [Myxococcaceae bacterium]|nr:DUF1839 family protein [Myxococcaceae bacterium]